MENLEKQHFHVTDDQNRIPNFNNEGTNTKSSKENMCSCGLDETKSALCLAFGRSALHTAI